jgi:uncharacterized membrane protein
VEVLWFIIAVVVILTPIVALVALVRSAGMSDLRREVARLATETEWLRKQLAALRRGEAPEAAAPAAAEPEPATAARTPAAAPRVAPAAAPPRAEAPAAAAPAPSPVTMSPPMAPSPPPREPRGPRPRIEWERFVGVRGAAILGAAALALAGLLFFQYSIQQGWISPAVRVAIGIACGVAALVGSELLRKRDYRVLADGLAGAGVVILHAAAWAAHVRYQLIGVLPTYALMTLTTVMAALLAVQHAARLVAIIGLVGGFATPLVLSSRMEQPLGVFTYVLLLDAGLLVVARRRGWPGLGLLAVAGTALPQLLWLGPRMEEGQVLLALGILGAGGLLFALLPAARTGETTWSAHVARASGLLLPFAFALYLASRSELDVPILPLGAMLLLLCVASAWVSRQPGLAWLPGFAAAGAAGVLLPWAWNVDVVTSLAWKLAALVALLCAAFHAFVESRREDGGTWGAEIVSGLSGIVVLLYAAATTQEVGLAPWLAGFVALAALLFRGACLRGRSGGAVAAAVLVALALPAWHALHGRRMQLPAPSTWLAVLVGLGVLALAAAFVVRATESRRRLAAVPAAYGFVTLLALVVSPVVETAPAALLLGAAVMLGVLVALGGAVAGDGSATLAAVLATAAVHHSWAWRSVDVAYPSRSVMALLVQGAAVVIFVAWPFLLPAARRDAWTWRAAALAGPAWFLALRQVWITRFGDGAIGILPILLGACALAAVLGARRTLHPGQLVRRTALAWLAAVALGFVALAIPLQLDEEWITMGWALQGLVVVVLWRRLDHPGLKWFGLALLCAVTVRLVGNWHVLGYHEPSDIPVLNWLLYTYGVPVACLVIAAVILARHEVALARPRELALYPNGKPTGALLCGLAAVVVGFVWVNLTVFDAFATGGRIAISFERLPARDLTLSLGWAVYGLVLLGIGMARSIGALRWLSLVILMLTIGKVFLHDLGELRDLYRVLSLLGLAVSLMLVSFLYQRFVFRSSPKAPVPPEQP